MPGRPRIPIDLARVEELARAGHTDADIARQVGVDPDTLMRRKKDTATFADAIQRGRDAAHSAVSAALYNAALTGNVPAITWYEKTRRGFRDTTDQELKGEVIVRVVYADNADAHATEAP